MQLQHPFHQFTVATRDGWLLDIFRLLTRNEVKPTTRVCLLWHGLATNHEIFTQSTEENSHLDSLATFLLESGFDVWLANSRGNKFTRHAFNHANSKDYWDFSLTEYTIDVCAVVDCILAITKAPSLTYIGFSQGSAIALAALALNDDLNHKINHFIGLAPALKPKKWNNETLHSIISSITPSRLSYFFGSKSFLPIAAFVSDYFPSYLTRAIIKCVIQSTLGWKLDKYGSIQRELPLYSRIFGMTSVKSFVHWFQIMEDGRFQHFKEGGMCSVAYPTFHITTKISLYCGEKDNLSDVSYLSAALPSATIRIIPGYEHLDLIWHKDAHTSKGFWTDMARDIVSASNEMKMETDRGSLETLVGLSDVSFAGATAVARE